MMNTNKFQECIQEYRKELKKGMIQQAYRGVMTYIRDLRTHLKNEYPGWFVSDVYCGYMDMTYFSFNPPSIKERKLKIAIVFIHETWKFEVWLAGYNKKVQAEYWELIKDSDWHEYHLVTTPKGNDAILECGLVEDPDFGDLETITKQIENGTLKFIQDVEELLSEHPNP